MTTTEFIQELCRVRGSFDWALVPDTSRGDRRTKLRMHIRATTKDLDRHVLDPLTAVCFLSTGRVVDWPEAGRLLQLSASDAWYIMAAARDLTWRELGGTRKPDATIKELRGRIVAAVGFAAQTPDSAEACIATEQ